MSSELKIINNRYQLGKKIGSGSFGIIFDAYDMKQKNNIAIKFESYMCDNPQLTYEYKIYKHLQGFYGIPKVYEMFKDKFHNEKYYGMSMDLFESSLEKLEYHAPSLLVKAIKELNQSTYSANN
jgi:casein kinase 1